MRIFQKSRALSSELPSLRFYPYLQAWGGLFGPAALHMHAIRCLEKNLCAKKPKENHVGKTQIFDLLDPRRRVLVKKLSFVKASFFWGVNHSRRVIQLITVSFFSRESVNFCIRQWPSKITPSLITTVGASILPNTLPGA